MTPLILVLIAGSLLHGIVNYATRTPDEDSTPFRWKAWHTFLAGFASMLAIVTVDIGIWAATGTLLPYWALLAAADLLTIVWKLWKHHQRVQERRALQALFDQ